MKVKRECNTCEFNFNGVCAGHGDVYNYGEKIIDDTKGCDDWGADFKYFSEVMKEAPWYIKNDYENCKISFEEFLKKLDDDNNGIALKINLYDAIEKIYDLSFVELAEVLGVSLGVVNYARFQGTTAKRVSEFSAKLCIPVGFFNYFTTHDLEELKRCKKEFESNGDPKVFCDKKMKWKEEKLIPRIMECLGCTYTSAQKYYTITQVKWRKNMEISELNELEKEFVEFIIRINKRKKHELISFEYLIDGIGFPKLYMNYIKKNN